MKKFILLSFSILMIISSNSFAQSDLIKQIKEVAEVNDEQAKGGAGAIFEMAKENMSDEDFGKVSDAVPGMDNLLSAVPSLGGKTSMLGSVAKQLSGNAKVLAAFDKLGISQDKVALFTPIMVKYVEDKSGKAVSDLLANAIK